MLTQTPKGINYSRLKEATVKEETPAPVGVVNDKDLIKCGGLYRIRDNYEAVWRMEAGEDGKRYIIRADDGGADTPERLAVSSDAPTQADAKAAATVTAYRVIRAGAVYVAWECQSCATPNLTKYGNTYECDECHKRFANVLQEDKPQQSTYSRAEVEVHNPGFAKRMGQLGINTAHRSLLQVWDREAKVMCSKCKEEKHGACSAQNCPCCGDKEAKKNNPWAICHESVGPEKSEKFERCVKDVKKGASVKTAEESDPPDEPGQRMQDAGEKKCKGCGAKMRGSSVLSRCPDCLDKEGSRRRAEMSGAIDDLTGKECGCEPDECKKGDCKCKCHGKKASDDSKCKQCGETVAPGTSHKQDYSRATGFGNCKVKKD